MNIYSLILIYNIKDSDKKTFWWHIFKTVPKIFNIIFKFQYIQQMYRLRKQMCTKLFNAYRWFSQTNKIWCFVIPIVLITFLVKTQKMYAKKFFKDV